MSKAKWISAAAGWFFAGPIGGIIGYYIGKNIFTSKVNNKTAFEISLLPDIAAICFLLFSLK